METKFDRTPRFAIGRTNHVLQSEIRSRLAQAKSPLSSEGASILFLLTSVAKPIRVNQLAKLAVRDGTTLKRQIDSLVKLGFAKQSRDESDGRVVLVSITESGKQSVESLRPMFDSIAS